MIERHKISQSLSPLRLSPEWSAIHPANGNADPDSRSPSALGVGRIVIPHDIAYIRLANVA